MANLENANLNVLTLAGVYEYFSSIAQQKPQYRFQHNYHYYIDINFVQPTNSRLNAFIGNAASPFNIRIAAKGAEFSNIGLEMDNKDNIHLSQFGYIITPPRNAMAMENMNNLLINFLSTELAIHENLFLEWMKEVNANQYIYPEYPFTKANLYVTYINQNFSAETYSYKFGECFPTWIESLKPNDKGDLDLTRQVRFIFNWVQPVQKNGNVVQSMFNKVNNIQNRMNNLVNDAMSKALTSAASTNETAIPPTLDESIDRNAKDVKRRLHTLNSPSMETKPPARTTKNKAVEYPELP
jgi:hypothetical protein